MNNNKSLLHKLEKFELSESEMERIERFLADVDISQDRITVHPAEKKISLTNKNGKTLLKIPLHVFLD